jgi:hypothetical protein
MKRLALVVGQPRNVLVAGLLLIVACDIISEPAATPAPDADLPSPASGAGPQADAATPVAPDAAGPPPEVVIVADAGLGVPPDAPAPPPDASMSRPPPPDAGEEAPADAPAPIASGPPPPWHGQDIGALTAAGNTSASASSFTVEAGGAIDGAADAFYFVHQALSGDGQIVARVAAMSGGQAGLMFRASLDPGAPAVTLAVLGDGGTGRLQVRATASGPTTALAADPEVRLGQFLRLARTGNTFTAYRSANLATWIRIASVEAALPADALVGLATAAGSPAQVQAVYSYAAVDNLEADPASAGWEHLDVGTLGGGASFTRGVLALTGFGESFMAAQDHFTGVVRAVSGGYRLTVRVLSLASGDPEARVGLMFREGLAATASRSGARALLAFSPARGVQLTSRARQGDGLAMGARKLGVTAPVWLRLEKRDLGGVAHRFTGWYSLDGSTWNLLDTVTFGLAEPLLVGIVAGGGKADDLNQAIIDDIALVPLSAADPGAGAPPGADGGP